MGNILTASEVRTHLDDDAADHVDELIDGVERAARDFVRCPLFREAVTFYIDGSGAQDLFMPWPLSEAPGAVYQSSGRTFAATDLLTYGFDEDYTWDVMDPQRLCKWTGSWYAGRRTIKVEGFSGWSADDMPAVIKSTLLAEVAYWYNQRRRSQDGDDVLTDSKIGDWTETFSVAKGMRPATQELLERYQPARVVV